MSLTDGDGSIGKLFPYFKAQLSKAKCDGTYQAQIFVAPGWCLVSLGDGGPGGYKTEAEAKEAARKVALTLGHKLAWVSSS